MAVAPRKFEKLDEDAVLGILKNEIDRAIGADSEIAAERKIALDYYFGNDYGNEQEGRSKANLTDVRNTIEWVMPSVMRMFTGGNTIVEYEPQSEEDVEFAKQATDVINQTFMQEMDGFTLLMDWMKTALLEKRGYVKVYEREWLERKTETYRGLDEDGLTILGEDEEVEILGAEERNTPEGILWDVQVRHMVPVSKICVEGIPPEEFLIASRATRLDEDTPFAAHRCRRTVSDLIAMGFDEETVLSIPSATAGDTTEGGITRHANETPTDFTADRQDAASREVWVSECFVRIDEDGDGYAEKRLITCGGDSSLILLEDIEVNQNPFCSLCPVPFPHKFHGLSYADLVAPLQFIRATLLRQLLDNIYLTNNVQTIVEEGAVEIEDLLTRRPGGVVRADHVDAVKPLETGRLDRWAFDMLEYLQGELESRTGVTRYNQGLDASSLNKTATGITSLLNAANARIGMIGLIFAETGFKDLFRKLLRLHIETPQKKRTMRLRNQWVPIDPRKWNANMDVTVRVGMGFGQAAERMQNMMQILGLQQKATEMGFGGFLVEPKHFFNAVSELTVTMGYKAVEQFFADPEGKEPPPPPPDPKMIEAENHAKKDQSDAQLNAARLQHDGMRGKDDLAFKYAELEQLKEIELAKLESHERLEMQKAALQARAAAEKPNA